MIALPSSAILISKGLASFGSVAHEMTGYRHATTRDSSPSLTQVSRMARQTHRDGDQKGSTVSTHQDCGGSTLYGRSHVDPFGSDHNGTINDAYTAVEIGVDQRPQVRGNEERPRSRATMHSFARSIERSIHPDELHLTICGGDATLRVV